MLKSATAKNTSPRTSSVSGTSAGQSMRNDGDRLDVGRDVFAHSPVASGCGAYQPAALVHQIDREAVDLELAEVSGLLEPTFAELAYRPLGPTVQLVAAERVVQAHQSLQVLDRSEGGRWRRTDLLGRRVGRTKCGKGVFELAELSHHGVELTVGDGRRIQHVMRHRASFSCSLRSACRWLAAAKDAESSISPFAGRRGQDLFRHVAH